MLHIGNIANNAYNNVKALQALGVEGDVLCYEYYHIMACPEWEDADCSFAGIDHNNPAWHAVDLGGFQRPRWFAQGPLHVCMEYLLARHSGRAADAEALWTAMSHANGLLPPRPLPPPGLSQRVWLGALRAIEPLGPGPRAVLRSGYRALRWLLQLPARLRPGPPPAPSAGPVLSPEVAGRIATVVERFARRFPDRADRLQLEDLLPYARSIPKWQELFSHYDAVIGYSTDAMYPLLADKHPYIGYEHGTIRDIPFEPTPVGRITALSFAEANVLFMTNADSIAQAKRLNAARVYGLHGFDFGNMQRRLQAAQPADLARLYGFRPGTKVFLQPARHHWRDGFTTWLKGNDRVVRAVAALKDRYPGRFKVLFVDWGAEVHLTKALIEELGVSELFHWIEPQPKADLWSLYRAVDCVIDQFVVPCIGSVGVESVALGRPVITALDDEAFEEFYGATIPLLNCRSVEDITQAMSEIVEGTGRAVVAGPRSREWFLAHHSGQVMTDKLLQALERAISLREPQPVPADVQPPALESKACT